MHNHIGALKRIRGPSGYCSPVRISARHGDVPPLVDQGMGSVQPYARRAPVTMASGLSNGVMRDRSRIVATEGQASAVIDIARVRGLDSTWIRPGLILIAIVFLIVLNFVEFQGKRRCD